MKNKPTTNNSPTLVQRNLITTQVTANVVICTHQLTSNPCDKQIDHEKQ